MLVSNTADGLTVGLPLTVRVYCWRQAAVLAECLQLNPDKSEALSSAP